MKEITKVKRYGRHKLESSYADGILFHYDFPVVSKDPDKFSEYYNSTCGKVGISMNGRMYFTREEWVDFFNHGLKVLEEGNKK
jgi:hypothetical protein